MGKRSLRTRNITPGEYNFTFAPSLSQGREIKTSTEKEGEKKEKVKEKAGFFFAWGTPLKFTRGKKIQT